MNLFIQQLAEIAQQHLLSPKWLLAPSIRVGNQWLECIVRGGQPVVGFRVLTLSHLAMELAASPFADRQLRLLPRFVAGFLMDDLLTKRQTRYLELTEYSPNLANALLTTIQEIRLAGLKLQDLEVAGFEAQGKGTDLCGLFNDYQEQLKQLDVLDQAGVLKLAIEQLAADSSVLPSDLMLLVPDCFTPRGLEAKLVATIPAQMRHTLPTAPPSKPSSDIERLAWLTRPVAAPPPVGDGSVQMFRATGAVNEVRQVLRTLLTKGIAMDDVEILHTNHDLYVPLIHELVLGLAAEEGTSLPISFAEGIAASSGRPGRALTAWLAWIEEDFDQQLLVRMLHEGLFKIDNRKEVSASVLTSELRRLGIGRNRDRYATKLREQITGIEHQLENRRSFVDEDDATTLELRQRLAALTLLEPLIKRLMAISDAEAPPLELLAHSQTFLAELARSETEVDNYAREALSNEICNMQAWAADLERISEERLLAWLRGLADRKRILGSGPRAGKMHVAHLLGGGHSGRRHTFILGLDDGSFPGHISQDPILLDREREQFHEALLQSGDKMEQQIADVIRTVSRLQGALTLSYPCLDLVDDRELFPSSIMLSAFRICSGNQEADQHVMEKDLGPPSSFASADPEEFLDETEWWLARLCGDRPVNAARELVQSRYPHFARGARAVTARQSEQLTQYDGYVPAAGSELDPATLQHAFSASGLEMVGLCPLKYFFSHALYVRAIDELSFDPDRWLDPLTIGSLLHTVFETFLIQLHEQGQIPKLSRDENLLAEILQEQIEETRRQIPPPTEVAYRRQCNQLKTTARMFLHLKSANRTIRSICS